MDNEHVEAWFGTPARMVQGDAPIIWVVGHARQGTKTMAALLDLSPGIIAFHEPVPRLWWMESSICRSSKADVWKTVFLACRWDPISQVCSYGHVYAEVNPRAVWFTHAVRANFPKAKIIMLMRNRDDTIRSMYRKRLYVPGRPFEVGRPEQEGDTRREKIANYYDQVDEFLTALPYEGIIHVLFDDFVRQDVDLFYELYGHLDVEPPSKDAIKRVLDLKLNAGDTYEVEKNW